MKKNLIIALIVLLIAGLFVSCDGTVNAALAGGSKDSYITFEGTGKFTLSVAFSTRDDSQTGWYTNGELDSSVNSVLEFSSDASTWQDIKSLTAEEGVYKLNSSEDGKLYLRGKNNNAICFEKEVLADDADFALSVSGNIMTLLDYENPDSATMGVRFDKDNLGNSYGCFSELFAFMESLTDASQLELPAQTLKYGCYCAMFNSCENLISAPELPATTLAADCYLSMFADCTSLKSAPELPATTLAKGCYDEMFDGCESLTKSPELPATTLAQECYYEMFYGCINLVEVGEIKATTMATDYDDAGEKLGCCFKMFCFCDKLKITTTGGTKCFTCPNEVSTVGYEKAVENMFAGTVGGITTPVAGTTYYWTN